MKSFLLCLLLASILPLFSAQAQWPDCLPKDSRVQAIPADHILNKKTHRPLILGHRGNPGIYQENTYDGFVSLLDTNADGFELDVFLTKDDQLVLFHEPNTEHLTGTDRTIYNMTYAEILSELNLKAVMKYGENTYDFGKTRKMPLLDDILKKFADEDMLIFIEMKPDTPVGLPDMNYVNKIGAAVGNIVRKYNLEHKSVVNSFDFWKVRAAKMNNPKLVVGNYFYPGQYDPLTYDSHRWYASFPGLEACARAIPDNLQFMQFIYQSGAILKLYNGSFYTVNSKIINNPKVSNLTKTQLSQSFRGQVSSGAYTIYRVAQSVEQIDAQEKEIDGMMDWGVDRLIADDVYRLLRKFRRARNKFPDCATGSTGTIPEDHLFHKKNKPLIIGHRGNPKVYQENTMDGFESLIQKKYVDGFELDVFLTKDKKLAVFHDADLEHLTGEKMNIYESTYEEISKAMVKKEIDYSGKTFTFEKARPIPLLEDVYKMFQDKDFLVYTEIKSTRRDANRAQYADEVAEAVVAMIAKYNMEKKVFVNSFDALTTEAVKRHNPNLVVGTFFYFGEFAPGYDAKAEYDDLPNLSKCLRALPNGPNFTEYLLMTGAVLKAYQGAFFDMDYKIYPRFMQEITYNGLADYYGHQPSTGAWTIYKMTLPEAELKATDGLIHEMIDWGLQRLITDDPDRVAKLLDRYNSGSGRSAQFLSTTLLLFVTGIVKLLTA